MLTLFALSKTAIAVVQRGGGEANSMPGAHVSVGVEGRVECVEVAVPLWGRGAVHYFGLRLCPLDSYLDTHGPVAATVYIS